MSIPQYVMASWHKNPWRLGIHERSSALLGIFEKHILENGPRRGRGRKEASLLLRLMGLRDGATILEAGCGFAGLSLEWARRGYRVTALDSDGTMLAWVRSRARDARVRFVATAVEEIDWDAEFDAVVNGIGPNLSANEKGPTPANQKGPTHARLRAQTLRAQTHALRAARY